MLCIDTIHSPIMYWVNIGVYYQPTFHVAKHQGEKRDESRPLTPTKPLPPPQPKGTQSPRSPRNPLSPTSFLDQMTQKLGLTSPTFDGPSVLLKRPTMKGTSGIVNTQPICHSLYAKID